MSKTQLLDALDLLAAGGITPGAKMEEAHAICQDHEGQPLFDWIHALVHRIEGDDGNADYWYRRAGRARHQGSAREEWHVIRDVIEEV